MHNNSPYHILAKYYDEFQSYTDIRIMQEEILDSIAQYQLLNEKNLQLKIADLGCGTGIFALVLAERGYAVTAIDLSEQMIRITEAKKLQLSSSLQDNLRIVQADLNHYIFPDQQDVLLALTDTLNHLDAEQFVNFFSMANQNLRNGGLLIFDLLKLEYLLEERSNQTYFVEFDLAAAESHNSRNSCDNIKSAERIEQIEQIDSKKNIAVDDFITSAESVVDESFSEQNPAVSMVWENEWLAEEQMALSYLTFFERAANSDQYLRFTDQIIEYYHDLEHLEPIFCKDFSCIKTLDFPERKLFILQKTSNC
ncbi:MAG: class I SAM-dependent DNA methyltransferase [Saccharofermentanales bacterium]|jgi:SAM-dependent methyltransferase